MSFRHFDGYGDTAAHDGPPPTVEERAKDEMYANAVNGLAAVLRFEIAHQQTRGGHPNAQMAYVLRAVANDLIDGWSVSALPCRGMFDDYGPGGVMRALIRAYEMPQPDAPLVGD